MSFHDELTSEIIEEAFKRLLSEKHLYQSVTLDLTPIKKVAEECEKERSWPGSSGDLPSKYQVIESCLGSA